MVDADAPLFDPAAWREMGEGLTDITYHRHVELGCVRIAFDRPEVRNAFRPHTVDELATVLEHARTSADVGVVLLTGNGPSPRDGGHAFCSGGTSASGGAPAISTPSPRPRCRPKRRAGPGGCTSSSA